MPSPGDAAVARTGSQGLVLSRRHAFHKTLHKSLEEQNGGRCSQAKQSLECDFWGELTLFSADAQQRFF